MAKRKKRLEKQISGIEMSIKKHQEKLASFRGRLDTTDTYWGEEIKRLIRRKEDRRSKLRRK
ncbi:MAG: hypothetical protein AABW83_02425 [Nanoarchaeota archaeon]